MEVCQGRNYPRTVIIKPRVSSFKMNNFWSIHHYLVKKTWIFVSIDMVNVGWDLKRIILKNILETINYNKDDPVV